MKEKKTLQNIKCWEHFYEFLHVNYFNSQNKVSEEDTILAVFNRSGNENIGRLSILLTIKSIKWQSQFLNSGDPLLESWCK